MNPTVVGTNLTFHFKLQINQTQKIKMLEQKKKTLKNQIMLIKDLCKL